MKAVALAGGALGLVALCVMIVLLAMTLGEIRNSREHIEATDAKVSVLLGEAAPVLEQSDPLLEQVEQLLDPSAQLLRQSDKLLKPLVNSGDEFATTARIIPSLVYAGRILAETATPLVEGLRAVDLPAAVSVGGTLAGQLLAGSRLTSLVDDGARMLDQLEQLNLLPRLASSTTRLRRVLKVQRQTLAIQQQSLAVQEQTLDVQLEALGHIRSIDQKTGGQVPGGLSPAP